MTTNEQLKDNSPGRITAAFPVMAAVFISFMVIGMALPVLPLQVHNVLGFDAFIVGIVAGCQFAASLVSRIWAGKLADRGGPKYAVRLGLYLAIGGGLLYTVSVLVQNQPNIAVCALLLGRVLSGSAESLIITGGILWALQLVSSDQSAKVISWVGMSMFAALAIGAPIGSLIFKQVTFTGIAVATIVFSLVSLLMITFVRSFTQTAPSAQTDVAKIFKKVLLPGVSFAFSGITFGAMTTFLTLYFSIKNWDHGAFAFAVFAIMLIVTRIFFGHLPDKFGGAKVTLFCLFVQAAGLLMVGSATSSWSAMFGAALSGAGFSLVFPGLGLEAIKRSPVESRGLAMGIYNAFLDVTLGFGSPALGYLASKFGIKFVFLLSAITALLAVPITFRLLGFAERAKAQYNPVSDN